MTTINPDDSVNCAAMGVEWGEQRIVIKPYRGTRTLRNLRATEAAVVNVTDDILLFSQAALGDPHPPTRRGGRASRARSWMTRARGARCAWRRSTTAKRAPASARRWSAVAAGASSSASIARAYAVLEASILASRVRMLEAEDIRAELRRLQVLVDKTGGPREREAMAYVRGVVGDP